MVNKVLKHSDLIVLMLVVEAIISVLEPMTVLNTPYPHLVSVLFHQYTATAATHYH